MSLFTASEVLTWPRLHPQEQLTCCPSGCGHVCVPAKVHSQAQNVSICRKLPENRFVGEPARLETFLCDNQDT